MNVRRKSASPILLEVTGKLCGRVTHIQERRAVHKIGTVTVVIGAIGNDGAGDNAGKTGRERGNGGRGRPEDFTSASLLLLFVVVVVRLVSRHGTEPSRTMSGV